MNIPRTTENYAPSAHYLEAFAKELTTPQRNLDLHTTVIRHGYLQFVWPSSIQTQGGDLYHMLSEEGRAFCPVFFGGVL